MTYRTDLSLPPEWLDRGPRASNHRLESRGSSCHPWFKSRVLHRRQLITSIAGLMSFKKVVDRNRTRFISLGVVGKQRHSANLCLDSFISTTSRCRDASKKPRRKITINVSCSSGLKCSAASSTSPEVSFHSSKQAGVSGMVTARTCSRLFRQWLGFEGTNQFGCSCVPKLNLAVSCVTSGMTLGILSGRAAD